jgi:LacI family transcriptional regulator
MNGNTAVDPELSARVHAAAERLQYRPSNIARGLSLGRTNTVALVVPDLGNPMFQQLLRGVMAAGAESGYRVLVTETADNADEEAAVALEARLRCDALILASPRMHNAELAMLLPQVRPLVMVNRAVAGVPTLAVDFAHGIAALVDHLVAQGHRDLTYMAGPPGAASNRVRLLALADAVRRHPFLRVRTVAAGPTIEDGYRVGDEVLETGATGVLAFNDLVAFGLLARFSETGVAVPADISVTGFDGIELARYATPSLTTVSVSHVDLGRRTWETLAATIEREHAVTGEELIRPELTVRSSSGPVPPARRLGVPSSDLVGAARTRVADGVRARWRIEAGAGGAVLEGLDVLLARYSGGTGMPLVHSPRPYLHPVHSLSGRVVTEVSPLDHRNHYGVSFAVADVDGTSYWGGRTFLPGQGPALLGNHGRQVSTRIDIDETGTRLCESLVWVDQRDRQQLVETRELTGVIIAEMEAWALGWHSRLTAPTGVTISSPALKGRPGAGYGGVFWRLVSADTTEVLTSDAESGGSRLSWVAVSGRYGRAWTSVVLVQDNAMEPHPWFVRAADYVGAGPSLAWDAPCVIDAGESLDTGLIALVVDRRLTVEDAADLADLALIRVATARREAS